MWLVVLTAWAADRHWERLPPLEAGPRDAVVAGDSLVVRDADGALWRWADRWVLLSMPTAASKQAAHLVGAEDGTLWLYGARPAWVQRFDGSWSAREAVPIDDVQRVEVDRDGVVWATGLFGQAAVRATSGWRALEGFDQHLWVTRDPTGGVWLWEDDTIHHRGGTRGALTWNTRAGPWAAHAQALAVGPDGAPQWGGGAWWQGTSEGPERLQADPLDVLVHGPEGPWGVRDDVVVDLTTAEALPVPEGLPRELLVASDVWVRTDTALYQLVSGTMPLLRATTLPPGLRDASGWGLASVVDANGDGLDDLVVSDATGGLRLLRQTPTGFVGELLGPPVDRILELGCDLDGNGTDEVLVAHGQGERPIRYRLLRTHAGWAEDVSRATGIDLLLDDVRRGLGRATCADLDEDGDPDLFVAGGGWPDLAARAVLLLNDGFGKLAPADLSGSPLGVSAYLHELLPADLDGDGDRDMVLAAHWGTGHHVLRREGDGLQPVAGAGLQGLYQVVVGSWLGDVDGDDDPDLIIDDGQEVRAWRGAAGVQLVESTDAWGLGEVEGPHQAFVADLDVDGAPELFRGERAWVFDDGRFVERTASVPTVPEGARPVALDVGGDGDLDVLWFGGGSAALWETASAGVAVAPGVVRSHGLLRRLAWLRVTDVGAVVASWGAVALAGTLLRRGGTRGPMSGTLGRALAGLCAPLPVLWAVEARPGVRLGVALGVVAAVGAWAWLERSVWRRLSRHRVGQYLLGERLGSGGMGTVYRALDLHSGAAVAVKLVHDALLTTPADRERYRREAQLGARVEHPGVVRILGSGEVRARDQSQPTAYLAMELVEGPTLREAMSAGPWEPGRAAAVVASLARGLAAVHATGVVHRDVKPENVQMSRRGPVLMDFGAAGRVDETRTVRDVLGTLGYLPVEQARGEAPTPASDVYALGVVLFELLAGRRPFMGADVVSLVDQMLSQEVPTIEGVPDGLMAVVRHALQREPPKRPTAAELTEALAGYATEMPVVAVPSRPTAARSGVGVGLVRLGVGYARHVLAGGPADLRSYAVRLLAEPGVDVEETQL